MLFRRPCALSTDGKRTHETFQTLRKAAAGLDKMDIRWILEEAATDCFRMGLEVGAAQFDPAYVIDAARSVPPSAVVQSNFMEAYAASLRSAIIQGVEVCFSLL